MTLANRAAAADRAKFGTSLIHSQFAQDLADYRQGRFDRAAATMRGEVSKVLGPAPKLVFAMALYQKGEVAEARKTLAAALTGHDWNPANVRDQDGAYLMLCNFSIFTARTKTTASQFIDQR